MKLLDRYLLRQVAGPFLMGVVAFVLVFVSANVLFKLTELVMQLGLSLAMAGWIFLLWLPGFIVLTFPLATLMAILIVFGRLSGDSELVAMYAGGVNFRRLVIPVVVFGLLISLLTSALNEFVAPAAQNRADTIVREATLRAGEEYREEFVVDRQVVNGEGHWVIADSLNVATQEMVNPVIIQYAKGEPTQLVLAKRACWEGQDWKFYDVRTTSLGEGPSYTTTCPTTVAHFNRSPQQIVEQAREPNEMTYRELREAVATAEQQKLPTIKWTLALQHKFSIPFACLVFALLAPALGIRSHRGTGSIGMGIAILIGFAYYVVWNYLANLAQQGGMAPFWAAWLPNFLTAGVGIGLVLRARR